jgi:hypothetical protein
MKVFYFILIIFLFSYCSSEPKTIERKIPVDSMPFHYVKLQELFKDFTGDTLYVYSDWSPENKNYDFKGAPMDSIQVSMLPHDIRANYNWNKDFGACYKFPLDSFNIALIARTSGEYVSSALKLFVFNLRCDSIVKTLSLADSWGDAGEASVYSSCVFKSPDKNLFILTYSWSSYDHSAGDVENDTIVEYWKSYSLYKLSKNVVDTVSQDSTAIVSQYSAIVQKLSRY